MQSRRDQVNAQNYLTSRLTSALVRADPDALESPTRRDVRGLVGGLVVAVLMLVGVAGWAFLSSRGSTAWRQPGTLIMDKSSGTRYLFLDGVLHPVRNVASARLLLDGAVDPVVVPGSRLADVPRGAAVGLPEAPELLPAPGLLNQGVWRACAGGGSDAAVTVDLGGPPAPTRIGADSGLLVSAQGQLYLLWQGHRLLLARPWAADVLGFGAVTPTAVPRAWLDLVPAGPDLAPVTVDGRGSAGPEIGGQPTTLGELFTVSAVAAGDGPAAHYILLRPGLTPLTATQFALAQAEAGAVGMRAITAADLAAAPRAVMPEPQSLLPARPPALVQPTGDLAACVEAPGVAAVSAESVDSGDTPAPARPGGTAGMRRSAALDDSAVDLVLAVRPSPPGEPAQSGAGVRVRAGGGALLVPDADLPAEQQPGLLVDGSGTAFPLTADAIEALGYAPEQAVAVPRQLPLLLPRGPLLTLLEP